MRDDGDAAGVDVARDRAVRRLVSGLMPRGMSPEMRREWRRVATMLAAPNIDRCKPHYVDTMREYCEACLRLRKIRKLFEDMAKQASKMQRRLVLPIEVENYRVKGRNGEQAKSHPQVAQLNEAWRQWRSLVGELGLSPAADRAMLPGQGDLFDESDQHFA